MTQTLDRLPEGHTQDYELIDYDFRKPVVVMGQLATRETTGPVLSTAQLEQPYEYWGFGD